MGPLIWTLLAVAALALAVYFLFCALLVRKFLARKPDHTKQSLDRLCQGPYGEMVRQERDWYPARPWEDVFAESYDGPGHSFAGPRLSQQRLGRLQLCAAVLF